LAVDEVDIDFGSIIGDKKLRTAKLKNIGKILDDGEDDETF
jgi:hypothetical protein